MMKTLDSVGRTAEILLVEDNHNDIELTRIAFEQAKFAVNLHSVLNGEDCLSFLRKEPPYVDAPTPDIILLDLNMPKMDGREVMTELANDSALKCIPIIVLTTSKSEIDILNSYNLHCNSYIVKPIEFEQFSRVIKTFSDYWFTLVVLPANANGRA